MKPIYRLFITAVIFTGCSSAPNMSDQASVIKFLDAHQYVNADWGKITFDGNNAIFSGHYNNTASFTLGTVDNTGEMQIILNGDATGNTYGLWYLDSKGAIYNNTSGTLMYYSKQ